MKLKRTTFVAKLWANADKCNPSEGSCPSNFGWEKDGEKWVPTWYIGPLLPDKLTENLFEGEERGGDEAEEEIEDEDGVWSEYLEDEDENDED